MSTTEKMPKLATIEFTVHGKPMTAGSKRAFLYRSKDGATRAAVTDDNPKSKPWQAAVAAAAAEVYRGPLVVGPVVLKIHFAIPHPKGHYGTGRNSTTLKASAPQFPTSKPDLLKLARGIEDALTGVVWHDDAQIMDEHLRKEYTTTEGYITRVTATFYED